MSEWSLCMVSKKCPLRRCFNPKNVAIGSSVHPIGQKLPFFNGNFSLAIKNSKFSCKMSIFWPMGQKDGDFLFWSTPEPMVTFLGLKNQTSP